MLADEIAADKIITEAHPGVDKIQAKILAAQKFSLASDFALAADGLSDNFKELETVSSMQRFFGRARRRLFASGAVSFRSSACMHA
jgi:hypothetical protein